MRTQAVSGDTWTARERGWAALVSTVLVGAVLYPLRQHRRPEGSRVDSFPLSYYPMFSARRAQHANVNYIVGVRADGSRTTLPHAVLGIGGVNQVRRQLNRVVREKRSADFAEVLAARTALRPGLEDVVRVEIVRGRFDLDKCLLDRNVQGEETLLAGADVVRVQPVSSSPLDVIGPLTDEQAVALDPVSALDSTEAVGA